MTPGSMVEMTSVEQIIANAAIAFGVSPEQMIWGDRRQPLVRYRQIAMAAARLVGWSYPAIGKAFDRDHTTVIHAFRVVEADTAALAKAQIIADEGTQGELFE